MCTAFQFPGQGSQHVGMGRSFHESSALARERFAQGDEILGFPLSSLCLSGPEATLRRTENAQPALFTVSCIACALLRDRGTEPGAAAGHSVGEYAALHAAGALTFEDGLRAVRRRGELMARVSDERPGTMAAIVGVPLETVEALCAAAAGVGIVDVANENGPSQTVVSGEPPAVERVMELAEEHEGGVAVPLAVSGAFHSRLMAPVAAEMAGVLDAVPMRTPRIPIVANVTGDVVQTPAEIRDALVRQVAGRVRWGASVDKLAKAGARRLVEVGPGRTLTRLARELARGVELFTAEELLASELPAGGRE